MAFISADYQLLPPATAHEILADILDLFRFLEQHVNHYISQHHRIHGIQQNWPLFQINVNAIAVSGSSAGGVCAYLAAIHASPKPRAVLSLYGMGGDYLVGCSS